MSFQALGLPEKICSALERNKITEPTAIQTGAIPTVLAGRDLISSARTGSGKTLAYALPVITSLVERREEAALVLVPTREIAIQVQNVMDPYLRALALPPPALVIGGVSFGPQIQSLRRRPRVIIATPGRLNDHLDQGQLRLAHVRVLVLDEADRMLDMGFLPQVKRILKHLAPERQTLLFSATMPPDLARACKDMLREPERVAVDAPNTANTDIEQRMQEVGQTEKQDALLEAINASTGKVLVFTRTKRRVDRVAQFLENYDVDAERIHGDRSQAQRQKAIINFRSDRARVLVATDIAARGLDIPLVELVINYDLPEAREDYVHRIGRTGRAGAQGVALSFVSPEERGHWASLNGEKGESRGGGARRPARSSQGGSRAPRGGSRPSRYGRPEREERPAGRFAREEQRERPARFPRGEQRQDHYERGGEREERAERPAGRFAREERRPSRYDRGNGAERPARFGGHDRPARGGDGERPSRFSRQDRPERGERPARPFRNEEQRSPRPFGKQRSGGQGGFAGPAHGGGQERPSRIKRWGKARAERPGRAHS